MAEKEQNERYKRFIRPGEEDPDLGIFMDAVVEDGKGWIEAQKNYTILLGSEKLGKLSGTLLVAVVSALFVAEILVMCSIALAIWLGRLMGDLALGFLAVAGIYLVLTIVVFLYCQTKIKEVWYIRQSWIGHKM